MDVIWAYGEPVADEAARDALQASLNLGPNDANFRVQYPDGRVDRWTGNTWSTEIMAGGALNVLDLGLASTKHDRYLSGITDTWPGDDTFSVAFTQLEDVRRYRWKFVTTSGTVESVKIAEDAVNEAQEEAWLADPVSSRTADVENRQLTATDTWSEWIELSKDPDDLSLSRLGFLAKGTTPVVDIHVEAE